MCKLKKNPRFKNSIVLGMEQKLSQPFWKLEKTVYKENEASCLCSRYIYSEDSLWELWCYVIPKQWIGWKSIVKNAKEKKLSESTFIIKLYLTDNFTQNSFFGKGNLCWQVDFLSVVTQHWLCRGAILQSKNSDYHSNLSFWGRKSQFVSILAIPKWHNGPGHPSFSRHSNVPHQAQWYL